MAWHQEQSQCAFPDGQVGLVDLLGFSHHDGQGIKASVRRVDLQGGVVALERDEQVAVDCKDSIGSRHLEH
jgi:hypothetical protein